MRFQNCEHFCRLISLSKCLGSKYESDFLKTTQAKNKYKDFENKSYISEVAPVIHEKSNKKALVRANVQSRFVGC